MHFLGNYKVKYIQTLILVVAFLSFIYLAPVLATPISLISFAIIILLFCVKYQQNNHKAK